MGRTVMTYGTTIAYIDVYDATFDEEFYREQAVLDEEEYDSDRAYERWSESFADFGYDDFIEDLRYQILQNYPSFYEAEGWHEREGRIILENAHCKVVVCSYMDMLSINLVVEDWGRWSYEDIRDLNIAEAWVAQVDGANKMAKLFDYMGRRIPLSAWHSVSAKFLLEKKAAASQPGALS